MGMLLEKIDTMAEAENLLLDRLNIRNGFERLAPVSLQEASAWLIIVPPKSCILHRIIENRGIIVIRVCTPKIWLSLLSRSS